MITAAELRREKAIWGNEDRRAAELEEKIDDFMADEDAIEQIVACDYDMVFGLLEAIYVAGENGNEDGMLMFAKSLHRYMRDTAQSIVVA